MLDSYLSIGWNEIKKDFLVLRPIFDDVFVWGEDTTDKDVVSILVWKAKSND